MREFKFRAWSEYSNKLVVWEHMKAEDTLGSVLNGDDKKIHVMQYTGLKDKNGCEIYEGDIVRFKHKNSIDWEASEIVYFGDGEWQYPAFDLNAGYLKSHFDSHVLQTIVCTGEYDFEIIGNIYENPELLDGENL